MIHLKKFLNKKILENHFIINNQYHGEDGNKANMWGHFNIKHPIFYFFSSSLRSKGMNQ